MISLRIPETQALGVPITKINASDGDSQVGKVAKIFYSICGRTFSTSLLELGKMFIRCDT